MSKRKSRKSRLFLTAKRKKHHFAGKGRRVHDITSSAKIKHLHQPKKLSALCKLVINKYKLDRTKHERKDVKIDECYIVGGKPLRKRNAPLSYNFKPPKTTPKPVKKRKLKKTEETRKMPNIVVKTTHEEEREISKDMLSTEPETFVGIKEEQDSLLEDPLCSEDYLIEIKEEPIEPEAKTVTAERISVEVPSLFVSTSAPASSASSSVSNCPLGTVVMDDIQIFANRVAEQLRTLPPQRALLIQVEIQYMIDNEKQLLMDEQS